MIGTVHVSAGTNETLGCTLYSNFVTQIEVRSNKHKLSIFYIDKPFGYTVPTDFYIIWCCNRLTFIVPDVVSQKRVINSKLHRR